MPQPPPPPPRHRDIDDEEWRKKKAELRAKRKASKSSQHGSEKARKRSEHVKRTLEEQRRQKGHSSSSRDQHRHKRSRHSSPGGSSSKTSSTKKDSSTSGASAFQAMFAQRAEGFKIEFSFRNAPPRPPVGPCFMGQGLDGQLQDLAVYRPMNAVEVNHIWKLHAEQDLGVPLAPSAMDLQMYEDAKAKKEKMKQQQSKGLLLSTSMISENSNKVEGEEPLHPDDEALVHWKGSMGDTAAERYQKSKDRVRAAARLALAKGGKQLSTSINDITAAANASNDNDGQQFRTKRKKKEFSRVLKDGMDFKFMKKTTYLANYDSQKVHDFKSLAATKTKEASELQDRLKKLDRSAKAVDKTFEYFNNNGTKRKLQHPTKKQLKPVWELPLLPDVSHWGNSYTHVVLDNPPKPTSIMQNPKDISQAIQEAFIAHVIQKSANERATCELMVPVNENKKANVIEDDENDGSNKEQCQHSSIAQYDLDVIPLKGEDDTADTNFCLLIDVEGGLATYIPVPSKINLTTGRPSKKVTTKIYRRTLTEEERHDILERTAQVDFDAEAVTKNKDDFSKPLGDFNGEENNEEDDGDEGEEAKTAAATREAADDSNADFGSSDEDEDEDEDEDGD